jgi:sugar lactone lactonase YvrE
VTAKVSTLFFPIYVAAPSVAPSFAPYSVTTIAGTGDGGYNGDNGNALSAHLNHPEGIAVDASSGNIFIADTDNNRVRMIANGIITTIAGTGFAGFSGDNGPATSAQLNSPEGIAIDAVGNILIVDTTNQRLRMISKTTGVITTIAGTGVSDYIGNSGDNGPATSAQLSYPTGISIDTTGNILIADRFNNRVRMIANGIITTIAGTGDYGFSGDNGPATSAQLKLPNGVAVDLSGNILIADTYNQRLRMVVKATGYIITVAGTGTAGYNGDNMNALSARLYYPHGIAIDASGNILFSDSYNSRIRMVSKSGIITTIATVGLPFGIVIDGSGNILFTSYASNSLIRINVVPMAPTALSTG